MGLGQHTQHLLRDLLRPPSWQGFGALLSGAAIVADHTMFKGLPGPIDARMTIPTTNRYLFYNAGLRMHLTHSLAMMMLSGENKTHNFAGSMFTVGILFYSGCAYGYCWNERNLFKKLQRLGNIFFLAGWVALFYSFMKSNSIKITL